MINLDIHVILFEKNNYSYLKSASSPGLVLEVEFPSLHLRRRKIITSELYLQYWFK